MYIGASVTPGTDIFIEGFVITAGVYPGTEAPGIALVYEGDISLPPGSTSLH